jgi:hypothetical protein
VLLFSTLSGLSLSHVSRVTCRRKRTDALEAVPLLSRMSPYMLCASAQPQHVSITMMMLLLHPLPLVALIARASDRASATAEEVGSSADSFRSSCMLLLLHAHLHCHLLPDEQPSAVVGLRHKLALITTLRRMWLLELAIGTQQPPPHDAFNSGPEREFEFLTARLGVSLSCGGTLEPGSSSAVMRSLVDAVVGAAKLPHSRGVQPPQPGHGLLSAGLPLQLAFHELPECFSDLLVAGVAPCGCGTVHRAAALCL